MIKLTPKYRCEICNRPLDYMRNYIRNEKEVSEYLNNMSFWERIKNIKPYILHTIDKSKQIWRCKSCHEDYMVEIK